MASLIKFSPREDLRIKMEALFRRMGEQEERAKEMVKTVHAMCDRAAEMRKLPRLIWPR